MMPITASVVLSVVAGLFFSVAACAPPTPKIQQGPAAVPPRIEQRPQGPAHEVDQSFRPMVQEEGVTTPTRHG